MCFLRISVFKIGDHIYPCLMSAAFKFGVQKQLYHVDRKPYADDSAAEAENVRVIVSACHACGERVGTASRADALVLVRRHAHADAGAADEYAAVALTALYRGAGFVRVLGVMHRFAAAAEIDVFDVLSVKVRLDRFFEFITAVIAGYRKYFLFHVYSPFGSFFSFNVLSA